LVEQRPEERGEGLKEVEDEMDKHAERAEQYQRSYGSPLAREDEEWENDKREHDEGVALRPVDMEEDVEVRRQRDGRGERGLA